jgi:hypothetical protein
MQGYEEDIHAVVDKAWVLKLKQRHMLNVAA